MSGLYLRLAVGRDGVAESWQDQAQGEEGDGEENHDERGRVVCC